MIFTNDDFAERNMIKGIDFLIQSSLGNNIDAHFALGFFYYEGSYIKKDIKKSIYHYKEASSFNNCYAKNNLGIIYKNGFGDEVQKNIGLAILYFDEAIKYSNDILSIYNLAHLYLYEYKTKEMIDKSIELLINSLNYSKIPPLYELLFIALIKNYGFDFNKIEIELQKKEISQDNLFIIMHLLESFELNNKAIFEKHYQLFKNLDYMYNYNYEGFSIFPTSQSDEQKNLIYKTIINNLTSDFYDGFGYDI